MLQKYIKVHQPSSSISKDIRLTLDMHSTNVAEQLVRSCHVLLQYCMYIGICRMHTGPYDKVLPTKSYTNNE